MSARREFERIAHVVMKNCEPLVPGPAFAMESNMGFSCLWMKFSSAHNVISSWINSNCLDAHLQTTDGKL